MTDSSTPPAGRLTGRQWATGVIGLVVTALIAHLLPGLLLALLFSGLPGSDGMVGDFVFSAGALLTIVLGAVAGVPFLTRWRQGWPVLAGLVMTLVMYLGLAVWAVTDSGRVDELIQTWGTLLLFGARLGPFWLTLLVCSLGIWSLRRLVRPGPRTQTPYNSDNI